MKLVNYTPMNSLFDNQPTTEADQTYVTVGCVEDYRDFKKGNAYKAKPGTSSYAAYLVYDENNMMQAVSKSDFERYFAHVDSLS